MGRGGEDGGDTGGGGEGWRRRGRWQRWRQRRGRWRRELRGESGDGEGGGAKGRQARQQQQQLPPVLLLSCCCPGAGSDCCWEDSAPLRAARALARAPPAPPTQKGESARRLSKHKSNEQGTHGWGVTDAAKASFEPECAGCRRPHLEIEEADRHTPTPGWARRRHHWARVRPMRGRRENAPEA